MRLRLVREPFDHPDYIFELKHDGFRAIAYLQNGESKLVSRNQRNLGFEALKRSLAKLPVENAILDGEIIWHVPSDRLSDGENICDLGRECEAQGGSAWMQGPFSWPEIVNKHLIVERFFAPADE
jgi:hypothetical protein